MSEKRQIKRIPAADVQASRDEASLRSIEISQIRILARKRPDEFKRVYLEIFIDKRELASS